MSTAAMGEFGVMVAGLTEAKLRAQRSMKWGAVPPDVLPAWVAQMDFAPPACIRAALMAQIDAGDSGYAHGAGIGEAVAGWAARHHGWAIAPVRMAFLRRIRGEQGNGPFGLEGEAHIAVGTK